MAHLFPRNDRSTRRTEVVVHAVDELDAPDAPQLDEKALAASLHRTFGSPDYQPPQLPAIALEILALSRRPDAGPAEVTRLLERDSFLGGRVLSLANSSLYGRGVPILSLAHAVARLGMRPLQDLVLEAALQQRVFRADCYRPSLAELARHSTATAFLSRIICRYTSIEAEHAFACGLLHDVGIAAALLVLGERKPAERPSPEILAPVLARVHGEFGSIVLRAWKVASELEWVVRHHHQARSEGRIHPLVAVVSLAEELAEGLGFGPPTFDGRVPLHHPLAQQALGLSDAQLNLIHKEAAEVRTFLGRDG